MEVKVYTIRINPPRWLRNAVVYVGLPVGAILGSAAAVRAGVTLTTFVAGNPIKAADVNKNFTALSDAITAATVPQKSVVTVYLSAADVSTDFNGTGLGITGTPYAGWAICNGSNGTPNLAGKFVRVSATASGATGGSDSIAHTHAIDHDHAAFTSGTEAGHTHATPAHQHTLPLGFDSNFEYWGADSGSTPVYGSVFIASVNQFSSTHGGFASGAARFATTDTSGAGTTGAGSAHSHSVDPPAFSGTSGPASATDNRPAFFELVALMRL